MTTPTDIRKPRLSEGSVLTAETWADFVERLRYHCHGEGVDDHCTRDPIFNVVNTRIITGFDRDYTDNCAVVDSEADQTWLSVQEYWDSLDDDEKAEHNLQLAKLGRASFDQLEDDEKEDFLEGTRNLIITGYREQDEVVSSHLTPEGAQRFIARKKHDYRALHIYVDSSLYSFELNTLRAAILSGELQFVPKAPAA